MVTKLLLSTDDFEREPSIKTLIWRVFGPMRDDDWHYAHTNVSAGRHRLVFDVNGDNYRAGIKDITLYPGMCPEYSESVSFLGTNAFDLHTVVSARTLHTLLNLSGERDHSESDCSEWSALFTPKLGTKMSPKTHL